MIKIAALPVSPKHAQTTHETNFFGKSAIPGSISVTEQTSCRQAPQPRTISTNPILVGVLGCLKRPFLGFHEWNDRISWA